MTTGRVASLQAQHFAVNYLRAEQHHQPLHRTHEFNARSAPAHTLGNRQLVEAVLHDGRQQLNGVFALYRALNHQLAILTGLQIGCGCTGTGSKAFGGFGWLTIGVKGDIGWRAVEDFFLVCLLGFECFDAHRQTAWCGERDNGTKIQTGVFQALFDAGGECGRQVFQRLWWQLFGTQFNQKILCTHYLFSWAAAFSLSAR